MESIEPKKRWKIRIWCGKCFYRIKRYLLWYSGKYHFATKRSKEGLPYSCTNHKSLLLRKLSNVDMRLQYQKINNLKIAISLLDGILIHPGETLSYWKLIGKPTKRKGYQKGMVLFCGTFQEKTGGGLCQLSNLIYWMALHTELTITERYRHSYDVFPDSNRTQPFGSGATCVYNYRDLMLTNHTNKVYQLRVWLDQTHLCGEILCSTKPTETYVVYEKEHYFKRELFGKYSRNNVIYRKIYDLNHMLLEDEYVTENHALMMYEPYLSDDLERK